MHWNGEVKCRSLAGLGLHPDSPSMAFHDILSNRQTDAVARVLRARVQTTKDRKDIFSIFRSDPDAVIADGKTPRARYLFRRHMHARRLRAVKLEGISDQVSKELPDLRLVGEHHREWIMGHPGAGLLNGGSQVGQCILQNGLARARGRRDRARLHARKSEQIVDQRLRPPGAIYREADELVRIGIELTQIPLAQHFREGGDRAQRLLKVVRSHISKLLQLAVGTY